MTHFELGQVVEIELMRTGERVRAWTVQLAASHIWLELHAVTQISGGERIKLHGDGWCLDALIAEVRESDVTRAPLVKVAVTEHPIPVQRREYFRVPATLPVTLSVRASRDVRHATGELIAVTTVDLSGGGVLLETDHALLVGDLLELSLGLPARMIHVSGTVTRVAPPEPCGPMRTPGRDDIQIVGVELGPMMERDRAELVLFVHDVERKLRSVRGA